jgi:dynein heavy chain
VGLQQEVKNLMTVLPLISLLRSPAMQERHWRELKASTGKDFEKGEDFCLSSILDLELHTCVPEVEYIVELANKEKKISGQLSKIEEIWGTLFLEFGEHQKKGAAVPIIIATEEILISLEENMASLQAMQGQGKYVEHFIDQVTHWQKTLSHTESVLADWLEVQQGWVSLESIFLGSKDIRVQLPEDSKRFDGIDENFRQLMDSGVSTPNVIEACGAKGRGELLTQMKTGLAQCERSLFQYLETKRLVFPRFYFIANAALLDILSNGYDPQSVQKHLGDCFDAIKSLKYIKDDAGEFTKMAEGMSSKDGKEYCAWLDNFEAVGAVEDWLNLLVLHMQGQLRELLSRAKLTADQWEIEKPRDQWLYDWPAQIALTASQIIWTEEVHSTFDAFADGNEQAMKDYLKTCTGRVEAMIQLVLGKLEPGDRVKIMTLITVDVHNRDVVNKLVEEKVTDVMQFAWQSQMRYEWKSETKETNVRVADACFGYQFEYVGNTGRLVITPLTDRCYITLTQAMNLIMGGAPAGPAGTGKTETVKDLGRACGLPVYVFNCSEQMM